MTVKIEPSNKNPDALFIWVSDIEKSGIHASEHELEDIVQAAQNWLQRKQSSSYMGEDVKVRGGHSGLVTIAVDDHKGNTDYLHITRDQLVKVINQGTTFLHDTKTDKRDAAKTDVRTCEQKHEHSRYEYLIAENGKSIDKIEARAHAEIDAIKERLDEVELRERDNVYVHNILIPRIEKLEKAHTFDKNVTDAWRHALNDTNKRIDTLLPYNYDAVVARLSKLEDDVDRMDSTYPVHKINHTAIAETIQRHNDKINNLFGRVEKIEVHEIATENKLVNHIHDIGDLTIPGYFGEKHQYKPRNKRGQYVKEKPGINTPKIVDINDKLVKKQKFGDKL